MYGPLEREIGAGDYNHKENKLSSSESCSPKKNGLLNLVRKQQTLQFRLTEPPKIRGCTLSKTWYSLIRVSSESCSPKKNGLLNLVRKQQTLQFRVTEPAKIRGCTLSKKWYSLIRLMAFWTSILSLAISWVLDTSEAVNFLLPESDKPLVFRRKEELLVSHSRSTGGPLLKKKTLVGHYFSSLL